MQGRDAIPMLSRRRLLLGGLLLAGASPAAALASAGSVKPPFETAQPPSAPTPKPAASWIAYEASLQAQLATPGGAIHLDDYGQELLVQANVFRSKAQLTPYKWDDDLATCAKAHALDMARRNYFGHATPEGFTHLERVALLCRDFCGKTAENLAWRSSQAPVRA